MALSDKKILESERNTVYVKSTEGSRLTGTVAQNKNVFDKFPQLIMDKYNELIDLLIASGLDTIAEDITNRYTKTQVDDLVEEETGDLVADVGINLTTGVITITKKDGTATTIDTALEKVPATFEFVQDTTSDKYYIKVTNVDGTSSQTEVTNLMNQYSFSSGDIVQFSTSKSGTTTTVSATIKAGSITMTELNAAIKNYFDSLAAAVAADRAAVAADKAIVVDASQTVTGNVQIVLQAKETATENANLSKSYAVGGTGTRQGEDTDNAQYYANQAKTAKEAAEAAKNEAQEIVGGDYVTNKEFTSYQNTNNTALGNKVDKETGKGLSTNDYTDEDKAKVDNLPENTNTSLENKVSKETGKGLSTNDYTTEEKNKVANLPTNTNTALAEKGNIQGFKIGGKSVSTSSWSSTTSYGSDIKYRASIADSRVTSDMVADVHFNGAAVATGVLSPISLTYNGGVYIFATAKPSTSISIDNIMVTKAL